MIGPRTKIIREFPLNLICVYFKGKSLLFFSKKSTFRPIFEKCQPSSVILKIVGATPQLAQNINPQDICPDNFFLYIGIYGYSFYKRIPFKYIYIYIYTREKLSGQTSCGFIFWSSWGVAPTIFKITLLRRHFSKMSLKVYFLGKNNKNFSLK